MRKFYLTAACLAAASGWISCVDTEELESKLQNLEDKTAVLEQRASEINGNAISAYKMITEGQIVMAVNAHDGNNTVYRLDLSDGSTIDIYIAQNGKGITPVVGVDEQGNWIYSVDGGNSFQTVTASGETAIANTAPLFRANNDSIWEISTDGGNTWTEVTDADGNRMPANSSFTDSFFESASYDETSGELVLGLATGQEVTIPVYRSLTMEVAGYEDGMGLRPGEEKSFDVTFSEDVVDATIRVCPEGWRVRITEDNKFIVTATSADIRGESQLIEVWLMSDKQYIRKYKFSFILGNVDPNDCTAWKEFVTRDENNVLLDFSYAGYDHGESAPAEVTVTKGSDGTYTASNGYKVYNIEDYGAKGDDDLSDRDAFLDMLEDIFGAYEMKGNPATQVTFPSKNSTKAVIYFPEGNYILHTSDDNVKLDGKDLSQTILIRGGDLIMKGAGRDKTTITMKDLNLPNNPDDMYSSPDMLQFKHNAGIQEEIVKATVTGSADKGDFSIEVGNASGLSSGQWVCLYLQNNSQELVTEELAPYPYDEIPSSWVIKNSYGVSVKDLHQIKSISGNTVTFHEPIMHEVDPKYEWTIVQYQAYQNVGVEDLTFAGNAKERFDHHLSWEDDGAFKPVSMTRVVNSWMRRVDFVSVSEACSIIESANVSVYDCEISGNRGHSAIRSQASSRVFIGAVRDIAHGYSMDELGHDVTGSDPNEITGQYHAVGVSKESMGAVLWRNTWGSDGCFESHATQPRATLIDCCEGSWRRWREGGDYTQMPNHLADLTVWNFTNTTPYSGEWIWWDKDSAWGKFLQPIVVGFHGESVTFNEEESLRIESNGSPVQPESLYEAQLEDRLGTVPGWLTALKAL